MAAPCERLPQAPPPLLRGLDRRRRASSRRAQGYRADHVTELLSAKPAAAPPGNCRSSRRRDGRRQPSHHGLRQSTNPTPPRQHPMSPTWSEPRADEKDSATAKRRANRIACPRSRKGIPQSIADHALDLPNWRSPWPRPLPGVPRPKAERATPVAKPPRQLEPERRYVPRCGHRTAVTQRHPMSPLLASQGVGSKETQALRDVPQECLGAIRPRRSARVPSWCDYQTFHHGPLVTVISPESMEIAPPIN